MGTIDAAERSPVGRTGLTVPRIAFGTSAIGDMPDTYGYGVEEERAKATVRAVLDGPVKFLDTSRNYGAGRSEERIGAVIRERGGLPEGFVLSSKLDRDAQTNLFDAGRARRSLEESLAALNVEHIDILHLHDPEHTATLDGVSEAIAELFRMKEEGLATAVGLAAGRVDVMMPLLAEWDFDVLITHNRFTLANRNAEAMIDFAVGKGMTVFNAAPYASGVLAKGTSSYRRYVYRKATEALLDPIRRVEAVCARHNVPTGAAALQFSMRDPRITATICGVSRPERVAQTLEWATYPTPDALWEELAALPFSRDDPEAARGHKSG